MNALSLLLLSAAVLTPVSFAQTAQTAQIPLTSCSQMGIGQGASLNGFVPFPKTDAFNQDISSLPVSPESAAIVAHYYGAGVTPNFGSGTYAGIAIGLPYQVVSGQPLVPITYNAAGSQSDQGPMPIPANAPVEGAGDTGYSDHHVLILDQSNCFLYELFLGAVQGDGSWQAYSGAIWDMLADNNRPFNWTSADAAGLPIFPGLVRYDEVAAGAIHHAIRFTLSYTKGSFILPATHQTSDSGSTAVPPMGAKFRLKASFDISGYSATNQIILQAMKTYGLILADNGSNMFITGAPDPHWNNDDLNLMRAVKMQDFDMVTTGTEYTEYTVPTNPMPDIITLNAVTSSTSTITKMVGNTPKSTALTTATPLVSGGTVARGTPVTFTWSATNSSYYVLSPGAGPVRGNSVTVSPTASTTYTLYANSHIGSVTKTFTVNVR